MATYIKHDVKGFFVTFEDELQQELYTNLGTTWEDFIDNDWVKLSDEQVAFRTEHPQATVVEVWNMEMTPPYVRTLDDAKREKKSELDRYYNQHVRDFKYNGESLWIEANERLVKKNEAQNAKNNGIQTYSFRDGLEVTTTDAISLMDCMSSREFECGQAVKIKGAEIDALEDIEIVDAVKVEEGFPVEANITDEILNKHAETVESNNEYAQTVFLMKKQINTLELTDAESLKVKNLYPQWKEFIGRKLEMGFKVQYNGKLYNIRQTISTVLDLDGYRPSDISAAALYEEINETNAGTLEDPIPYNNNMELFNGKYYIQNGIVYKCIRDSQIPLTHLLSALVGHYVEKVTA